MNTLRSVNQNTRTRRKSPSEIASSAPLSSQEKYKQNKATERVKISASLSESESEEDNDSDDSFPYNTVLGISKIKAKPPTSEQIREQEIFDILNDDDDDDITPEANMSTESITIVSPPKNRLVDSIKQQLASEALSNNDYDDDDDSFLYNIKDANFYENERNRILEEGEAQGYPKEMDEEVLVARTLDLIPDMRAIIEDNHGHMSVYHEAAKDALRRYFSTQTRSSDPAVHYKQFGGGSSSSSSNKASSSKSDKAKHASLQAPSMSTTKAALLNLPADTGYYGPRGQEAIARCLGEELEMDFITATACPPRSNYKKDTRWWLRYLGWDNYVVFVMVPETLSRLVVEDKGIQINEARIMVKESTPYGLTKFPTTVLLADISTANDESSGKGIGSSDEDSGDEYLFSD